MNSTNVIATILFYAGILMVVLGVIFGFTFGQFKYFGETGITWGIFFDWTLKGVISGLIFIGMAEIIKLLVYIKNLLERKQP